MSLSLLCLTTYDRVVVFFRLIAGAYVCHLISPLISAVLLEMDPWIPMNISLALHVVPVILALVLPEALASPDSVVRHLTAAMDSHDLIIINAGDQEQPSQASLTFRTGSPLHRLKAICYSIVSKSNFLVQDWRIPFLLSLYLTYMNINALSDPILLRYISERYSITLILASYFWSFEAAANMLVFLVIIPAISTWLVRLRGHTLLSQDILLPRILFAFLSRGLILVGLAPNLWTMTLGLLVMNCGPGGLLMVRLLLTSFVQHNEVASMYGVMLVLETAGMSVSGPLMAGLFNAGLGKGSGAWLGVPYLVCGLFFAIATTGPCAANLGSEAVPSEGEEGGENSLLHV